MSTQFGRHFRHLKRCLPKTYLLTLASVTNTNSNIYSHLFNCSIYCLSLRIVCLRLWSPRLYIFDYLQMYDVRLILQQEKWCVIIRMIQSAHPLNLLLLSIWISSRLHFHYFQSKYSGIECTQTKCSLCYLDGTQNCLHGETAHYTDFIHMILFLLFNL